MATRQPDTLALPAFAKLGIGVAAVLVFVAFGLMIAAVSGATVSIGSTVMQVVFVAAILLSSVISLQIIGNELR